MRPSAIVRAKPRPANGVDRRRHFTVILVAFLGLGCHAGVQAVLLADLARALPLRPDQLGLALSVSAAAAIAALTVGGRLADRLGRRSLLLLGAGGTGLFFLTLAGVRHHPALLVAFAGGGLAAGCYDLAVNVLGGDYERRYEVRAMTALHAGFSGGAAFGAAATAAALAAGAGFRGVYSTAGALFLLLAAAATMLPLPPRSMVDPGPTVPERTAPLWEVPGVRLATFLAAVCFFGDGALEAFTSVYLRTLLGSGTLLGGLGIAAFHLAGLSGRLLGTTALRRWGERRIVTVAGVGAAAGMLLALATTRPILAVAGLLLVGFSLSPVVPTALSLAGRAVPDRAAQAVSLVTTAGYTAFIAAPAVVGALAAFVSLRGALLLLVVTSIGIVGLATSLPGLTHAGRAERALRRHP